MAASDFDAAGRYVLRGFDEAPPMSSFLAGVGGFWGLPTWAFYVNRGQAVTSFGVLNKDGPIAKFESADVAYRSTSCNGFRTLLNVDHSGSGTKHAYQPFFEPGVGQRDMFVGMNELEIHETNSEIGLKTEVLYFTVSNEDFPGLVRRTTFRNLNKTAMKVDVLDGLMKLEPSGIPNSSLMKIGRTMEAWKNVFNMDASDQCCPFFHVSTDTADVAQVKVVHEGHFVVAFVEGQEEQLLPFVVDPAVVFGPETTLRCPRGFPPGTSPEALARSGKQCRCARTPCALAATSLSLAPGESVSLISVYGHSSDLAELTEKILPRVCARGYISQKREEAASLPATITKKVETDTASAVFNEYIKMNFWDNSLRGGLPCILGDQGNGVEDHPKVYHCFSRIHGDIERDYNDFQLDLTYYSQGPGNYRDVNQNRRLDVFLEPRVRDFNVRQFLSFVQADGYNPLTVASILFKIPESKLDQLMSTLNLGEPCHEQKAGSLIATLRELLQGPFRPGDLFKSMHQKGCTVQQLRCGLSREEFLHTVAQAAEQVQAAKYNQDGFWSDHWTYNLDLLDNYVSIYPDMEAELLFGPRLIPFFISPATVQSRAKKYQEQENGTVIQKDAVADEGHMLPARQQQVEKAQCHAGFVQDSRGTGNSWHLDASGQPMMVSVGAKLLMLGVLKFSTLDPLGMGIEMEAGKPGWNDAMNGLPGILGSTMPETYETLRLLQYLELVTERFAGKVFEVPAEMQHLLGELEAQLVKYTLEQALPEDLTSGSVPKADFAYWDAVSAAREAYRGRLEGSFSGAKQRLSSSSVASLLERMISKMQHGIARALKLGGGLSPTYFSYEVTIKTDGASGSKLATAVSFKLPTVYPFFLEGPVRQFKVLESQHMKADLHRRVHASPLYDSPIKMYKVCESLKDQPLSLGRVTAFAGGWLENESIWLHMSYKYYLELLRAGLFNEFFEEITTGLVPFMDPKIYGRSPLEASSFIVSSAFPDAAMHGRGFLARTSGSTAEMLSMWSLMMAGPKPFRLSPASGRLELAFEPALPSWLFKEDNTVSFTFLGHIKVTFHNPSRANTWELSGPTSLFFVATDGSFKRVEGGFLEQEDALLARELKLASIEVYY
ncbi:unnamed protein product [Polarella glacialis]|uniref:Uncharacterized protein n=1 Tax=Polarella glacialis TaxID=89957 RepID=A0A813IL29_POLGL|nr:unnamed protein product [Polarella glacialis]